MYDIYWYGSVHFRTAHRAEACVELARMFACTYLAFNEASVAEWIAEGSGISFDGKPLNTFGYLCEGRRLAEMANSYEYHNAATWRRGPVQGVRKWRGGRGYYRLVRTLQERRVNMAVMDEYGPKIVRGRRRDRNLPTSWDDIGRSNERGWKAQGKGRKNWVRGVR